MIGYQFLFYDSLLKRNPYIFFPDRVIGYCICLGKQSRTCRCFCERIQTSPVHAGVSASVYKRVPYMPVFLRACTNESCTCRCFYERVQTSPVHAGVSTSVYKRVPNNIFWNRYNHYRILDGHVVEMMWCDWLFTFGYIITVFLITFLHIAFFATP